MYHACRVIAILCLLSVTASAKDFAVNDQDQSNIQNICDTASTAPSLTRNIRAAVAAWCVDWARRVDEAAKPQASPGDDAKDQKPSK
jgi:hypothetical protein